jgi:hypothetical protein
MEVSTHPDRVQANTCPDVNARIRCETQVRVERLAQEGPAAIDARLEELEKEWDVERTLTTHASSIIIGSMIMGVAKGRGWFALGGMVAAFLLQHSVQGWCPPLGVIRKMGVRTQKEIDEERTALKAIRGDFDCIAPDMALVAAER